MIYCPYCDAENIEGADLCSGCSQPLRELHLTPPSSEVEKSLLIDRMKALQPKAPIVVPDTMTVSEVLKFLVEKGIGCVFVADGDEIAGVFTERDAFMRLDLDSGDYRDQPISAFMTATPKSLTDESKVAFAVRMMDQGGYRHILILDDSGQPSGVTSVRDILRYLSERVASA